MSRKAPTPPPARTTPLLSVSQDDIRRAYVFWLTDADPTIDRAEFDAKPIDERAIAYAEYLWLLLNAGSRAP